MGSGCGRECPSQHNRRRGLFVAGRTRAPCGCQAGGGARGARRRAVHLWTAGTALGGRLAAYAQPVAAPAQRRVPGIGLSWAPRCCAALTPLVACTEVVEFERFLAPTADEAAARAAAVARVASVVQAIWPSASVQVFGSFATGGRAAALSCSCKGCVGPSRSGVLPDAAAGLYLPTSDLDVVVVGSGCADVRSALKAMANSLVRRSMGKNIQVLPTSKLPLPLFVCWQLRCSHATSWQLRDAHRVCSCGARS